MGASGVWTGFEYYETPSEDVYDHAFSEALVVPDANVLLDCYRYGSTTRSNLLAALRARNRQDLWIGVSCGVGFAC